MAQKIGYPLWMAPKVKVDLGAQKIFLKSNFSLIYVVTKEVSSSLNQIFTVHIGSTVGWKLKT